MNTINHSNTSMFLRLAQWFINPPYISSAVMQDFILLAVRIYMANIFLTSGLLKLDSWSTTLLLFEYEFKLPFIPFAVAAVLAAGTEIIFGGLLMAGLLSSLSAFVFLMMTLVIEIFVLPGTAVHPFWMLALGTIIVFGGGRFSLDYPIKKHLNPNS